MITIRSSRERGATKFDWLDSRHTFSFGDYHDPRHLGFRNLRVINEDRVSPGRGFAAHSHRDMEIITYVLEGAVEHEDSTGNQTVIRPGDVQRMSAGTGISHSEHNASPVEPVHFLQIWIIPERSGLPPSYEQRSYALQKNAGRWVRVASRDGRDGAVTVHQDVALSLAALPHGGRIEYALAPGRHAWVQITRGAAALNGKTLEAGDGAALSDEKRLEIEAAEPAEILLFDLA